MGTKKSKRGGGLFGGGSFGGGGMFDGIFSVFGWGSSSEWYDVEASYDGMASFLEKHGMSPRNGNDILFYVLRLTDEKDVRHVLAEVGNHGFGGVRAANWAYSQWQKYTQDDPVFKSMYDTIGLHGHNPDMEEAMAQNYFRKPGVPKAIYWFLQDRIQASRSVNKDADEL